MLDLVILCPWCEEKHTVSVMESSWAEYVTGGLAQNCFPYLNATEREQIISHLCPACQKDIFGE